MARDRKRAKQRQQRRSAARSPAGRASEREERALGLGGPGAPGSGPSAPGSDADAPNGDAHTDDHQTSHLTRADLPGALGHAGDVDEFDAALVRGAGGVPLPPGSLPDEEEVVPGDSSTQAPAHAPGDGESPANGTPSAPLRVRPAAKPAEHRQRLPSRAIAFLRASWAELQRVQWPNRAQVTQATAVVLGFVAIAGLYFGLADYVAKEVVEAIL